MANDSLPIYKEAKARPVYEPHGQQKSVECSVLTEMGPLPMGESTQGVTPEAMPNCSASDLQGNDGRWDPEQKDPSELTNILWPEKPAGGFLGRPNGWER